MRCLEPQLVLAIWTELGAVLIREDVALEISKVHGLRTVRILPHPCARSDMMGDESGPHRRPANVSLFISPGHCVYRFRSPLLTEACMRMPPESRSRNTLRACS